MARYKRGTSGNPSGRPRGAKNKFTAEIKDLIANRVPFTDLVDKLYALAKRGNVRAAEVLLAYAYGKPRSTDDLTLHSVTENTGDISRRAEEWLKKHEAHAPDDPLKWLHDLKSEESSTASHR